MFIDYFVVYAIKNFSAPTFLVSQSSFGGNAQWEISVLSQRLQLAQYCAGTPPVLCQDTNSKLLGSFNI